MFKNLMATAAFVTAVVIVAVLVPTARWPFLAGAAGGLAIGVLLTVHAARYRLPTEGWAHWFRRVTTPNLTKGWQYYRCILECDHHAVIRSSRQPRRGDIVWCPGHHRTRAEQTRVALVNTQPDLQHRPVVGAALDEDLLLIW